MYTDRLSQKQRAELPITTLETEEEITAAIAEEVNYILGPLEPVQVPEDGFTSDTNDREETFPAIAGYCEALIEKITPDDQDHGKNPVTSHPYLQHLNYLTGERGNRELKTLEPNDPYLQYYGAIDQELTKLQPGELVPTLLTMLIFGGTYDDEIILEVSEFLTKNEGSLEEMHLNIREAYRMYLDFLGYITKENTLRKAILNILWNVESSAQSGTIPEGENGSHVQLNEIDFHGLLDKLIPPDLIEFTQEALVAAVTNTTFYRTGSIQHSPEAIQFIPARGLEP